MHNSKSPETPRKLFLEIIKNTERKKYQRGPTPWPRGWGARPLPRGPPVGPPVPIFCYMKSFVRRKTISKLSGRDSAATRRNLGGTNLGLRRSCSARDTSLRNTLLKTVYHFLLLLVGFDTLTYQKDNDRSPILVGHQPSQRSTVTVGCTGRTLKLLESTTPLSCVGSKSELWLIPRKRVVRMEHSYTP